MIEPETFWVMRHGRPDVPRNPVFMDHHQFSQFLDAYDEAGLSESERLRLVSLYADYPIPDIVVASDLPRALATAHLFARGRDVIVSPLLREIPVRLPEPTTRFLRGRWPAEVWWSYLRYHWFFDQEPEGRTLSTRRALAAIQLVNSVREPGTRMAVVSHAGFLLLMINLLQRGHQVSGRRLPHIGFGEATAYRWRYSGRPNP